MAFNPAYAKYEPGTYLAVKVIEEIGSNLGESPATAIDFGLGDAQYKTVLSNERRQVASLYIFAPTIMGAVLNLLKTFADLADRAAKVILERAGFLSPLKRFWRRYVVQT